MGTLYQYAPTVTATSDYPELVVEWLPAQGPKAPDGDWCDITSYVTGGKISRGRQYEIDQFQAGTCDVTLVTPTRLFDPEWTGGPFYPWLVPMRQIRVSAIWNSTRYPVFRGYITDWGQTVADDTLFTVTIQAKDAFVAFEQIKLPSSAWAAEIVKDNPSMWLRLGETGTVRVTDSSPGGNYGLYDNCVQGAQGLVKNDADNAAEFAHSLEERVVVQNPNLITGYPFTIEMMFQILDGLPGQKSLFIGTNNPTSASAPFIQLYMSASGRLIMDVSDGVNRRIVQSASPYDDNQPHHVTFVFTSSSTWAAYVDGQGLTLSQFFAAGTGLPSWRVAPGKGYTIGNTSDLLFGDFGFGGTDQQRGTIDEVVIWNGTAITPERITAHSLAALNGWDGDTTSDRMTRFLDLLDWPNLRPDVPAFVSTDSVVIVTPPTTTSVDLIVTAVNWATNQSTFGTRTVTSGDRVQFSAVVQNTGSADTPGGVGHELDVAFYVDGDLKSWEDTDQIVLSAGASRTESATGGPLGGSASPNPVNYWTATAGTHSGIAFVNPIGRTTELTTANNQTGFTISVSSVTTSTGGGTAGGLAAVKAARGVFPSATGNLAAYNNAVNHWGGQFKVVMQIVDPNLYQIGLGNAQAISQAYSPAGTTVIPMFSCGLAIGPPPPTGLSTVTLANMAAGAYDSAWSGDPFGNGFLSVGGWMNTIPQGAIARLGWEMNGTWYPWNVSGTLNGQNAPQCNATDYISAFRHVHDQIVSVCPTAKFDWCPNSAYNVWGFPSQAYPGDGYVDYIGWDVYEGNPADLQADWDILQTFAQAHGKQISLPEYGLDGQFNTAHHEQWLNTLLALLESAPATGGGSIGYHCIFDSLGDNRGFYLIDTVASDYWRGILFP